MKILATGRTRFVGLHLRKRLSAGSHEVLCVDNLFTSNKYDISKLMENNKF